MRPILGIDFGTTNSVVAALGPDGGATVLRHGTHDVFRSVLCFRRGSRGQVEHAAGPKAIEAYLDDPFDSRLIMSMKGIVNLASVGTSFCNHRALATAPG